MDRRTHRDLALKLLRTHESCPCPLQLGHLSHPNITTVLETGTLPSGIPFIAMELRRGENLGDVLARQRGCGRALRVDQVARIAHEVCAGLAEAHRWDVVHRDIKPSNVFLTRQRSGANVKLIDFGLARIVKAPELEGGAIAGTPVYVAPERLGREPYDWRVDIYAVGVLLYEMLGVPLRAQSPPALHQLRSDVPPALSELATRALRRDPGLRPWAAEMAQELAVLAAPLHGLTGLLGGRGVGGAALSEQTLESLEPRDLGELDTLPQLPHPESAPPGMGELSDRTTTAAAARPKDPVTNAAVPSMRALRSQSCRPFLPPGQTQRKPTPSS